MTSPELTLAGRTPRVLLTGAGGPAAVAFLRAVGSGACTWFAADIDPFAAGLYLVGEDRRFLLPRGDDPSFPDALLALCVAHGVDVAVPTVDTELPGVAARRADFAAAGVRLLLAPTDALRTCLDKWELARRCTGVVAVPATVLLDAAFDPSALRWPAVVKPRRGSGSRGVAVIADPAALDALPRDGSLLVQDLLPGQEYSVDVLCRADGSVAVAVPRTRDKVDSGIAVAGRTVRDPELERFATRVARAVGMVGIANVQVKLDRAGVPALLEVNPRPPGTMPLTVAAGANLPAWALAEVLGGPPAPDLTYVEIGVVRHWTEVFVDAGAFARTAASAPAAPPPHRAGTPVPDAVPAVAGVPA